MSIFMGGCKRPRHKIIANQWVLLYKNKKGRFNMLTKIKIKNFKRFDDIEFELGKAVVLIGPNNSGKTTALQALALWDIGLRQWLAKRGGKTSPEKRPGVTINRRDLIAIPVPMAKLLWRDLHVRAVEQKEGKTSSTQNILIEIIMDGVTLGKNWSCGFEFNYANEESFYCKPLRKNEGDNSSRMPIPDEAKNVRISYLPPMSGLAAIEPKLETGRINVLIGEGQTAQVLRNLCYQIYGDAPKPKDDWQKLSKNIKELFGVTILPPKFIKERGEIIMEYKEPNDTILDLSSSGRGLQQTLLLLAYLYSNPNTVLLLDEPDAHLEILRQRQIYQLITEVAEKQSSQIIAASHSEVVLNEAADRDIVIAFVGKPHRIDDRGSQVLKSLKDIGFDQYYLAEETGWVLYLEGPTDLAILQAFAKTLGHEVVQFLEKPFVYYVGSNIPQKARDHFYGLREAKKDLTGIAIFDRIDKELQQNMPFIETMWQKREIENYLCLEETLLAYARYDLPDDLFGTVEANKRQDAMQEAIKEVSSALSTLGKPEPWSPDIKATDDFLDPLFKSYFKKLKLPNLMQKRDYNVLAQLVPKNIIDSDIVRKLDTIVKIGKKAKPLKD